MAVRAENCELSCGEGQGCIEHRLSLQGKASYACFNVSCSNRSAGQAWQYQVSLPEDGLHSTCVEGLTWVGLLNSSDGDVAAGIHFRCRHFEEVCSHLGSDVEFAWSGRELFFLAIGVFLLVALVGFTTAWVLRWRQKRAAAIAKDKPNPDIVPREVVISSNSKQRMRSWVARSFCSSFCSSEPGSSGHCQSERQSVVSGSVPTIIVWPPSPAANCTASCQVIVPNPVQEDTKSEGDTNSQGGH
eukprot:CAMPEP_0197665132 /NCGR_PEP_ID=MMETSP1338-20131121/59049_1 /TAXON_ID=43686 ORGANISM="Pelagodinium beii, Strain RCC1491" /NCGR_SAMPLE_ID=MMETSP1338 /ASSEMBLY_ACC=CAM_ASM_000754 /LENGTH=243 /DNA_ID=CAMNT_0043243893 /DNA_START=103 /DNA_END=834 /DNA_ORIENTATION=-